MKRPTAAGKGKALASGAGRRARQGPHLPALRPRSPRGPRRGTSTPPPPEPHAYIGERFDPEAGLISAGKTAPRTVFPASLNARYYDPKLAKFLQPDRWEVTEPGVGTNSYAYAGGDPVNGSDPGGHEFEESAEPRQNPWWARMFLETASHNVFSGRTQAAGYENTITNRTMNAAVNLYKSPGAFIDSVTMDRKAGSQALSPADLLIQLDDIVHVFELKPEAQLANPSGRRAAAAQLDGYVKFLIANGVTAIPAASQ